MGSLEVLSTAKAEGIRTLIIVITTADTMNNAVEAMKRGAHDYLTKPFANLNLVAAAVRRAVEISKQAAKAAEFDHLKESVAPKLAGGELIGHSPAMQEVFQLVERLSRMTPPS